MTDIKAELQAKLDDLNREAVRRFHSKVIAGVTPEDAKRAVDAEAEHSRRMLVVSIACE
jgi:hypothetical protein